MHSDFVQLVSTGMVAGWALALGGGPGDDTGVADGELMRTMAGGGAGGERAFERLYDRYARPVFSLLVRVTHDHGKAEDLLQEVFTTAWKEAAKFDPEAASALPWLLVMARNRALDRVRSAEWRRERSETDETLEWASVSGARAAAQSFEARVWEKQAMEKIHDVLRRLTPDERRVIEMAYFDGCSQSEISAQTGCPLGTVKTWTRNGLAKLRNALQ